MHFSSQFCYLVVYYSGRTRLTPSASPRSPYIPGIRLTPKLYPPPSISSPPYLTVHNRRCASILQIFTFINLFGGIVDSNNGQHERSLNQKFTNFFCFALCLPSTSIVMIYSNFLGVNMLDF